MRLITSCLIETVVHLLIIFLSIHVTKGARLLRNMADAVPPAGNRDSRVKSAAFQLPLNSSLCLLRSRCDGQTMTFFARNCFCDKFCRFYDDCCVDYALPSITPTVDVTKQTHAVATCMRMGNRTKDANSEIWVLNRCPPDYLNEYVRGRCEWSPSAYVTADTFLRLPVNGAHSRLLYANAYCALCSGETQLIFWDAVQKCGAGALDERQYLTTMSPIRQFVRSGCPIAFEPTNNTASVEYSSPRKCVVNIDRCDRRWTDYEVVRKCRQRTDYVYAGNHVFRNSDCARCNYVNQTYLKCENTRMTASGVDDDFDDAFSDTTFSVTIRYDFKNQLAFVSDKTTSLGKDVQKSFALCMEGDGRSDSLVYDPFAGECRSLFCRADESLGEDGCVKRPASEIRELVGDGGDVPQDSRDDAFVPVDHRTALDGFKNNNDDAVVNTVSTISNFDNYAEHYTADAFVEQATAESDEPDEHSDCDPIQIEKHDYYELTDGSETIHVKSMNHEFKRESYNFDENNNLFVCSSHWISRPIASAVQPVSRFHGRYNFTVFSYAAPYERLVGIFELIFAILCTLISLATFWAFPAFRSSVYGKSFFCFMTSVLLVHALFLSIQIVDKLAADPLACFCLSAAAQFSALAYAFWLNVMSIIVMKSLLRSHATVTFAPVAETSKTSPSIATGVTSFLFFSLYAWVTPLIIVAVSIALATFKYDGWYDPDKRVSTCWTLGLSQLLLLIVPISVILAINYVIFAVIFFRICPRGRRRRGTSSKGSLTTVSTVTEKTEQQLRLQKRQLAAKEIKKHEERYTVCFQLTVLTTVTWTFATVSVFTRWPITSHLFIAFQAVLAVTVSLIVVCNSQVWRVVSARKHARSYAAENGVASHSASVIAKYCTFETDGATIYLKDNGNKIIMRETSI